VEGPSLPCEGRKPCQNKRGGRLTDRKRAGQKRGGKICCLTCERVLIHVRKFPLDIKRTRVDQKGGVKTRVAHEREGGGGKGG